MTEKDDKNDVETIISDDDFVSLMDAEYMAKGKPVDVLSKKRVWGNIIAKTKDIAIDKVDQKTNTKKNDPAKGGRQPVRWSPIFAVAAMLTLVVSVGIWQKRAKEFEQLKGGGERDPVEVKMMAYTEVGGEWIVFDEKDRKIGQVVVLKVSSSRDSFVALVGRDTSGHAKLLVEPQKLVAGTESTLGIGDEAFGVQIEQNMEIYCVVASEQLIGLNDVLRKFTQGEVVKLDGNCMRL